jgi:hypothetical protein
MVRLMGRNRLRASEQFHQHHASHKATDMRPKGHAADLAAEGRQTTAPCTTNQLRTFRPISAIVTMAVRCVSFSSR